MDAMLETTAQDAEELTTDAEQIRRWLAVAYKHQIGKPLLIRTGAFRNDRKKDHPAWVNWVKAEASVEGLARYIGDRANEAARAGTGDAGRTFAMAPAGFGSKTRPPDKDGIERFGWHARENLESTSCFVIDADKHPVQTLTYVRKHYGEPTMIVESGGLWENAAGELQPKIHIYYAADKPVTDEVGLSDLEEVRNGMALLTGADTAGGRPTQTFRVPGSWHTKGEPRLCRIVGGDPKAEYSLVDMLAITRRLAAAAGIDLTVPRQGDKTGILAPAKVADETSVFGAAMLKRAYRTVSNTRPGEHRRDELNRQAFSIAGLVASGHIVESEAWDKLGEAGVECDLDNDRIDGILADAFRDGLKKPWGPDEREEVDIAVWFEEPDEALTAGAPDGKSATVADLEPKAGGWLAKLNAKHAVVVYGDGTRVAYETPNGKTAFLSRSSFFDMYANTLIPSGTKNKPPQPMGEVWFSHPDRRQALGGIEFNPNGTAPGVYNLWRGFPRLRGDGTFTAETAEAGCPRILEHIRQIVCDGDETAFHYLIRWLAHLMQHPGDKPGVAVIIRGAGLGTGKDTLGEYVGAMIGLYYAKASTPQQITGQFNAHFAKALFVHGEEVSWHGREADEGVLKSLITAESMGIEPKGIDQSTGDNFLRLFATSNKEWVVPARPKERRYFIVNVSESHLQDTTWFSAIKKEMRHTGPAAFKTYLQSIDLTGFDVRKPPVTPALLDQIRRTVTPFERWWGEIIEGGTEFKGDDGKSWEADTVRVEKKIFKDSFTKWCREHREHESETDYSIAQKLSEYTGVPVKDLSVRTQAPDGARRRCYPLPAAPVLRQRWEVRYGG